VARGHPSVLDALRRRNLSVEDGFHKFFAMTRSWMSPGDLRCFPATATGWVSPGDVRDTIDAERLCLRSHAERGNEGNYVRRRRIAVSQST
jgi:hypothetical protein